MIGWIYEPVSALDRVVEQQARTRQGQLTKPPGSLGRLEQLAVALAAMQGQLKPRLERIRIVVFAADHGVAAEGVSAFPQAVTAEMVRNFARGGAAISVLARQLDASLEVIDAGTVHDPGPLQGVMSARLGPGTANFAHTAAMTREQLAAAFKLGREAAERAGDAGVQLFIGGEMGIANSSVAAAVAASLLGLPAASLAGPGAGLDSKGISHKAQVIENALQRHSAAAGDPLESLRCLGGFEIAALSGAYLRCAQQGIPVLVDGFIATVAALAALRLQPDAADWFLFAHASAEPGHAHLVEALGVQPLLDLDMRLGEGSGAAIAVPLLRAAVALHNQMATFAEAGISGKDT